MGRNWGGTTYDNAVAAGISGSGMLYVGGGFEDTAVEFAPVDPPCNEDSDLHDSFDYYDAFLIKYLPDGCW